jgi:hypothetical protein
MCLLLYYFVVVLACQANLFDRLALGWQLIPQFDVLVCLSFDLFGFNIGAIDRRDVKIIEKMRRVDRRAVD